MLKMTSKSVNILQNDDDHHRFHCAKTNCPNKTISNKYFISKSNNRGGKQILLPHDDISHRKSIRITSFSRANFNSDDLCDNASPLNMITRKNLITSFRWSHECTENGSEMSMKKNKTYLNVQKVRIKLLLLSTIILSLAIDVLKNDDLISLLINQSKELPASRGFFSFMVMAKSSSNNDAFNIEKLLEYNELVTCFGQMHKEFEQCNKRGAEKAKSFFGQIDFGEEWTKRLKCCGTWKLRDCWMKAAKQKCTRVQADMVYKLPELIMPALVEECHDYTQESGKCTLPIWLILIVMFAILFIVVICCGGIVYCYRRYKEQKYRRRRPPTLSRSKSNYQNGVYSSKSIALTMDKSNGIKSNHVNHNNQMETTLDNVDYYREKEINGKPPITNNQNDSKADTAAISSSGEQQKTSDSHSKEI